MTTFSTNLSTNHRQICRWIFGEFVDQSFNYLDHWFVYIVMYRVLRILMIWLIDVNYAIIGKGERGARISPQGMV